MSNQRIIIGTVCWLVAASAAHAHEEGDIVLGIKGGSLTTSFLSTDGHLFIPNNPVYPTEFESLEGSLLAHHPRFLADAGTFSPGTEIGFNFRAPLSIWVGPGFAPINPLTGPTVTVQYDAFGLSATSSDGLVPGFSVFADDKGGLTADVEYILNGAGSGEAAPGVYLLEIEFFTTVSDLEFSRPTWLVMNHGMDKLTFETAFAYVFDFIVPAPGSQAIVLLLLAGRRRRRS